MSCRTRLRWLPTPLLAATLPGVCIDFDSHRRSHRRGWRRRSGWCSVFDQGRRAVVPVLAEVWVPDSIPAPRHHPAHILTEIYLCGVYSCQEILRRKDRVISDTRGRRSVGVEEDLCGRGTRVLLRDGTLVCRCRRRTAACSASRCRRGGAGLCAASARSRRSRRRATSLPAGRRCTPSSPGRPCTRHRGAAPFAAVVSQYFLTRTDAT
jgi:hypothetical protein